MPTVFRQDGFRFIFYSNEGSPPEPVHIHVMLGDAEAKFWLAPEVTLAASADFDARTLRRLGEMVAARRKEIERAWREHFG